MLGMNIKRIFQMATEWNAVILLDEADVFMAERHPHDIARNELVSIFLRELEYYRGIIFLTTNLYQTIDSAFRSRVSLHLLFKPLSLEARESVWRKFLERLPKSTANGTITEEDEEESVQTIPSKADATDVRPENTEANGIVPETTEINGIAPEKTDPDESTTPPITVNITDEDIKELAAWQLNGREIKNAVKMVKSWCDCKGYEMTLSRLENGIRVTSPHSSKVTHERDLTLYDD